MDPSDRQTAVSGVDEDPSVSVGRRRAQSCCSRQTLPSPTATSRRSALGSPGLPSRTPSSRRHGVVRRLSPAAVEAARLAIAARQAYARRESSRSMGETALFIVTNDTGGEQRTLNEQDVAQLLQGNRSTRTSRPGTPGSRRSHTDHVSDVETPHSPTAPFSLTSSAVNSPKHAVTTNNTSDSGPGRKRMSSRGSVTSQVLITVESPKSTSPGGAKRPSIGSDRRPPVPAALPGSRKPSCYSTTSGLAPGNGLASSGSAVSKSVLPACASTTALTSSQPTRSPVKFAVAGVAMLAGTSAFMLSYVLGGDTWTLVGSTVMGVGSLVFILAICWYLANTPGDHDDERRRCESAVQIHVVNEQHLAQLIKQGACVKNVGVV